MDYMIPLTFNTDESWNNRHQSILDRIEHLDIILRKPPKTRRDLIIRYSLITERLGLRKLVIDKKGKAK